MAGSRLIDVHQRTTTALKPLATAVAKGTLHFNTDTGVTTRSNGTIWETYSGSGGGLGDVVGPAVAVDSDIALFDGVTGKLLKDGGITLADLMAMIGMQLIEEVSPVGVTTFSFAAIPATYRHLKLIWLARTTDASISQNLFLRFNGDAGANYDSERIQAAAATITALEGLAVTSAYIGVATGATGTVATQFGSGEVIIPYYKDTVADKNWSAFGSLKRANTSNNIIAYQWGGSWRNQAAINLITPLLAAGSFVAGSKFSLYGIR